MANENLTINGLAGMIKRSFDKVDQRFDLIDKRFDENVQQHQSIFNRLDKIEKNQKTMMMKLEDIVYRREFDELEGRVKVLEQALAIQS